MTSPRNRIVTRGMGVSRGVPGRAGLVTQGYGGIFRFIKEQAVRLIRVGQSGTKRALQDLQEVIVWAKLIRINEEKPSVLVQGTIKVKTSNVAQMAVKIVDRARVRVRSALEDLKITVKRIK